jgi:predicted  nucleic acid-binding Zn-ribbon protein
MTFCKVINFVLRPESFLAKKDPDLKIRTNIAVNLLTAIMLCSIVNAQGHLFAQKLLVDFTNRESRSISLRVGSADGISAKMSFAVLDSAGIQIAEFFPHEITNDRFWSGPLAYEAFTRVRIGDTVVRINLDHSESARLREQVHERIVQLRKERREERLVLIGDEKVELEEQINELNVESVYLKNDLKSLQEKLKREKSRTKRQVDDLQDQIVELRDERSEFSTERKELLDKRDTLLRRRDPPQDRISDLNSEVAELDRDIGQLNIEINDLRDDIRDLREETRDLEDEIREVREEQRELDQEKNELKLEVSELERELKELQQKK